MKRCKNCRTPMDDLFCPNCGQKDVNLERPMNELLGEVLRESFEIDGRTFRTIRTLFGSPGTLSSEFLAGRRRSYTSPLRLYLVISVSFFLLVAWFASQGLLLDPGLDRDPASAGQAEFMSNELPRLMFVLLPIFALLLKLAFPKRLFFDHIVYSLHLHSVAYVVLAFMLPLESLATKYWAALIAQVAVFAYFLIYFVASLRRVYGSGWAIACVKSIAILLGYLVIVSVVIETTSAGSFQILSD